MKASARDRWSLGKGPGQRDLPVRIPSAECVQRYECRYDEYDQDKSDR